MGLRTPSTCDRAVDSRDRKPEKLSIGESPKDETLGESANHFDPSQCREGDCTTTMRWLVAGAVEHNKLVFRLAAIFNVTPSGSEQLAQCPANAQQCSYRYTKPKCQHHNVRGSVNK